MPPTPPRNSPQALGPARPVGALRRVVAFALTAAALVVTFFIAVNTGSIRVTPAELASGLFVAYSENVAIIWDLRFPRVFIALIGGAALAVSGTLLQAVIRNPLADPGIIGVSSGAAFAALLLTALAPALFALAPLVAFAGGIVAFALVYALSWNGGLSPLRIILVGVAVSALFSALSQILGSLGGTGSTASDIVNANITMKTWSDFQTLLLYAAPALVAALFTCKRCDLLLLEDKTARSLGLNVNLARFAISAVAVLLASITTAVIGPISFLGLVVPHIGRLIVGSSHRVLVPYVMLLGALFLLVADTIGRTVIAPLEISAAVVMAVIGAPAFVALLVTSRGAYA